MAAPRVTLRSTGRLSSIILVTLAVLAAGMAAPASAQTAVTPHVSSAPINPRTHLRPGVTPKSGARVRAAAPAGAHLTYYGGHVISNVQVIQVLYGAGTYTPEVANTAPPSIASFYGAVTNSSYYDWLSEYNTTINASGGGPGTNQVIGRGTFMQQVPITPSAANSGSTVDDTNIQAELKAQIGAGHLPAPTANTYYAVYFPAGVTITQGGQSSGVQFCAYHGTVAAGSTPEFYYGVLPDFTTGGMTSGCGNGTTFQNETSVSSHELVEATTDAEVGLATVNGPPLAWYDATNGEIGDICNGQQQAIVGGDGRTYTVQQEWSNAQNNCVVSSPAAVNDFSISASPSSVSLAQGASGSSTISTAVTSGSAGSVSLSVSGAPSGATASLSPSSVTAGGSATLTINAGTAAAGNYTLTATGVEGSRTHATSVSLTITAPASNDFSISASPSSVSLAQGASGSSTISTAVTSGSAGSVSLSVSGAPSGATASLSPTSVTAGGSATLTINAGTAAAGSYTLTVTGVEGSVTHATSVSLTVTSSGGGGVTNGGFETGTFAGWTTGGAHTAITTTAHSGAYAAMLGNTTPTNGDSTISQTVTVPTNGQLSFWYKMSCPDTLTYDWALMQVKSTGGTVLATPLNRTCATNSSWVTVTASLSAYAGANVVLLFTSHDDNYGADPSYTLYDDVALSSPAVVNDFSISASPSSVSLAPGASGSSTISTAVTSGSAGSVSLSVSGAPSGATASLSPSSVTAGGSATLTINAGTAAAGSYTLTVTGVEGSVTHATSVSLTVTSSGGGGGVTNGGFETGTFAGWTTGGAHTAITTTAHSGAYAAMLGNTTPTNGDSTISQTVTVPTNGQLSFWYKMSCPDTLTYDWALMQVKSTGGTVLATPLNRTCATNSSWVNVTASLSAYAGANVVLLFTSHDDNYGADPSYTLYDDVALTAASPGGGGLVNGGFETGTFAGWTTGGAHTAITTTAHSGSYAAFLGNTTPTNGDSWMSQTVTVPATATTLSFWYANSCPDTVTYDWAAVQIRTTGGTVLATPLANNCAGSYVWTNVTYNVTSLRGQTVVLYFLSHDDNYSGDPTYTLYDDVTLV